MQRQKFWWRFTASSPEGAGEPFGHKETRSTLLRIQARAQVGCKPPTSQTSRRILISVHTCSTKMVRALDENQRMLFAVKTAFKASTLSAKTLAAIESRHEGWWWWQNGGVATYIRWGGRRTNSHNFSENRGRRDTAEDSEQKRNWSTALRRTCANLKNFS